MCNKGAVGEEMNTGRQNSFFGFHAESLDAHCHLQHDPMFREYAATCSDQLFFCMTETPDEYRSYASTGLPTNAVLGLGLHPWRVLADTAAACKQVDAVLELLPCAQLVGEVGLDFSSEHGSTRENQLMAFCRIARAAARMPLSSAFVFESGSTVAFAASAATGGGAAAPASSCVTASAATGVAPLAVAACRAHDRKRILSIHAVQAAEEALDILQNTGCLDACICIFHWFSGTGDQLVAARKAGCYFSFGPRALATKRGRAYAAQVPANRLLRETDAYSLADIL